MNKTQQTSDYDARPAHLLLIKRSGGLIIFSAIVVTLKLSGDGISDFLRYSRPEILDGQIWRLFTAHFIHHGWSHLAMNLTGLVLIWMIAGKWLSLNKALFASIFSTLIIGLGLLFLNPEISWYVGSSGIIHGLWMMAAIYGLRMQHWDAYALFALLMLKLAWEQVLGPIPGSNDMAGLPIIVDAHLYGAVSGLFLALLLNNRLKQSVYVE